MKKILFCLLVASIMLSGCSFNQPPANQPVQKQLIRVGYFPNITHAPAVAGMAKGMFQQALGDQITIEPKIFNAGPTEVEALFAGEIDLGFIGPSPAVNGYIKSNGQALQIIAGVTSGGASLVLSKALAEKFQQQGAQALVGKKIASPQQGNTQDISLRHYLRENNLTNKTQIIPIANADQLTMFKQNQLDGAWAPEPWATRLLLEAGGVRVIDERALWPNTSFCTTNIIVRTEFLNQHPDLVKKFLQANQQSIIWIKNNPEEAKQVVNSEIERLTTKKLSDEVMNQSWAMLDFTTDPLKSSVYTFADWAFTEKFLGETKPNLDNLYNLSLLNEATNSQY